jgi:hypothetical protein
MFWYLLWLLHIVLSYQLLRRNITSSLEAFITREVHWLARQPKRYDASYKLTPEAIRPGLTAVVKFIQCFNCAQFRINLGVEFVSYFIMLKPALLSCE